MHEIGVGSDAAGLGRARVDDASQVGPLLTQVDEAVGTVGGDGAYDKQKVFDALATPPSGHSDSRCAKMLKSSSMATVRPLR